MDKEKDLINSENTIKKSRNGSIINRVHIKRNEELNLYDTIVEKTTGYSISEYQKAYDINGNEIGEIKVKGYTNIEEEIGCYNYLDYKSVETSPYLGCQTLHFNNCAHLIPMYRINTIDEVYDASLILNESKIFKNTFHYEHKFKFEHVFRRIGEQKGELRPSSEIDLTINSYIEFIRWGFDMSKRVNFESLTDGETYKFDTNVQVVSRGHSRMICYISSDSFDDSKYNKSIKEVTDITLDIWGKEMSDIDDVNYIYYLNKGLSKISEGLKLIYQFHISYNIRNDKKIRIEGVLDNKIIKKVYDINTPEIVTEIRGFISSLIIMDGVYITEEQKEEINNTLNKVKKEVIIKEEPKRLYLPKKETKTYLMKNSRNGLYKIGKSITPLHREKTLQSEEPEIMMVKVWDDNIEDTLHKKYEKHRVRGEWFNLTKTQVKYICINKW